MLNVLFTSKYQIFLSGLFSWDIVRSFTWTLRLDRQQSGDLQSQIGADFPILARLCSLASIHFNHRLLSPWWSQDTAWCQAPGDDGDWPTVWLWLRLRWRHSPPASHSQMPAHTSHRDTGYRRGSRNLGQRQLHPKAKAFEKQHFRTGQALLCSVTLSQSCSKGQTGWTLSLLFQGGSRQ